ncbi:alpha/beta-hydrolase [Schizopora paradoxa]|uniref:Alpha/beta-hydrolase n=1 Tax=Schizopora paradoxa TaxID=27342 RepID=A0A0H2R7K8_9AGAM|nr:alpha/beta-hydrolase [Schizopora paradoxa]
MRFQFISTLVSIAALAGPLLASAVPNSGLATRSNPVTTKTVKYVTSSDGLKIYADSNDNYGKPAIIFTHGFALTSAVFDLVFENPAFAASYHLVRYDLRGQGRSGVPTSAAGHASKLYADDFAAVATAFGVTKPYTAAWSYGGTVLSDITTYLPSDYLSGSIYLAAVPFLGDSLASVVHPLTLYIIPAITTPTENATDWEAGHTNFTTSIFSTPDEVPIETKWLWRGMQSSAPPISYELAISRTVDANASFALGAKGYPLQVIVGTDDLIVNGPALVDALQPHFTKLSVHYVQGGGHSTFYQNSQEVVDAITKFVTENKWTGGSN